MSYNQECTFLFKDINYKLTYFKDDKQRLFQNGVELQRGVTEVLRNFIIENELPIEYKDKTTQQLSKSVLKYYSTDNKKQTIINDISKSTNLDNFNISIQTGKIQIPKSNSINENIYNLIGNEYGESVFLVSCSSNKILVSSLKKKKFELKNLEFNKELGEYRNDILKVIQNSETIHQRKKKKSLIIIKNEINFDFTETANKLYSVGKFYDKNASCSIEWSVEEQSKIYIISALFGIIKADDYIPIYDLAMTDKINNCANYAKKFWKGKLDSIIEELHNNGNIIYNLLGKNYTECLNKNTLSFLTEPKIKFTRSDSSQKRGKWLKAVLDKKY